MAALHLSSVWTRIPVSFLLAENKPVWMYAEEGRVSRSSNVSSSREPTVAFFHLYTSAHNIITHRARMHWLTSESVFLSLLSHPQATAGNDTHYAEHRGCQVTRWGKQGLITLPSPYKQIPSALKLSSNYSSMFQKLFVQVWLTYHFVTFLLNPWLVISDQ